MLVLQQLSLRRGVKLVLDRASVTLQPGEKVGLVGRNGAGKSSLFSLLAGRLQPDAGDVSIPPRWRVAEVAQDMPETEAGATDFVLEGDTALMEAHAQLAAAEAADDGHAMAEAHHAISEAGGFDARPRAQAMLMGLGFRSDQLDAPVNSFSGGWRMRLQLARALMCPADLMLLDEPTNHLDLDALVWLEAWLQRFEGTMIVISHDREFLDAVTRVIVHLDDAKLTRYGGNYTAFEEMRAERMLQQQANFEKQQERMAHLQKFIDRFKAKASKAKQAQSRVKALARMEKIAPVLTSADFQFEFREPLSLPNPMLAFAGVDCGYRSAADDGGDKVIVRGVNRSVLAGQRIGILGANGQGKSTLVKTIVGDLAPLSGQITAGKGLTIGYFAQQELDVLSLGDGPLMHMVRLARDVGPPGREQELRDFLGSFRFVGDMVTQPVGTLSGGEKARLVLAMLVWQRPNLLLMDEPTNHLDLSTREALSMALNEFEGTVMLVSHDRALLREVCDEFWLVSQGSIGPFDGDLDDYQRWLLEQAKAAAREPKRESAGKRAGAADDSAAAGSAREAKRSANATAVPGRGSGASPSTTGNGNATPAVAPVDKRAERQAAAAARQQQANALKPLRQELNRVDNKLGVLFAERDGLEASFATGAGTPADIAERGKRLKALGEQIDELEQRWLELSTQLDEASESAA
ncbi:ABC-F family ATP-binding cassette domain-containing protein [Piscinibacter koreensis]|uniref:Probable ATP-binding protein YheS n=1 Tax=Piscinibacter koreensis TaxID=2742824 RepID=A0A7Y6TY66_9BURK|nr:ATP-binding cassette domain-containing protein [Schlegelella koreensis]NUZ07787.1 ATP-binding cassette domain-containing protein [Schlegelella koreensis]